MTFDVILTSTQEINSELRAENLAELIFQHLPDEQDGSPLLLGAVENQQFSVSLRNFRQTVIKVVEWSRMQGLGQGDTVCLLRLPRTSELALAVAYAALSAGGLRVLLPLYLEVDRLSDWLTRSGSQAVFWSASETEGVDTPEGDRRLVQRVQNLVVSQNLPLYDLHRDTGVQKLLEREWDDNPGLENPLVRELVESTGLTTPCLLLTTSGTSGRAKLVSYQQGAFLRSCQSWEQAGMFEPERQGGRALCLLLAHSMGLRAFWNAVWTRVPFCMIHPEWFGEKPERVRSMLLEMKPEHITGGPAVLRTLLEMARVFPKLKEECYSFLRAVVSSGASFANGTSERFERAMGLTPQNAFGMTETMQVLSTLAPGPLSVEAPALGNLLPGVRAGLERVNGTRDNTFRMHLSSPFGFTGYLDEGAVEFGGQSGLEDVVQNTSPWFFTGDLVEYNGDRLVYLGREQDDFLNDCFGMKVARARLNELYKNLGSPVRHLEFFPLENEPGMAALIYLDETEGYRKKDRETNAGASANAQLVLDRRILARVEGLLELRNEWLHDELDGFEWQYFTMRRFACLWGDPPRTVKGGIRRDELERECAPFLDGLVGWAAHQQGIVCLDHDRFARTLYTRHVSPRLGRGLELMRLDKHFEGGLGDRVWYHERGQRQEALDLVGGFGGNLLGHRHPEVLAAAQASLSSEQIALFDQGARRNESGLLARALGRAVGRSTGSSYVVRFGSTGSEAVEMALAHAVLEARQRVEAQMKDLMKDVLARSPDQVLIAALKLQQVLNQTRPRVIALKHSFHGHSLGARALLGDRKRREPFAPLLGIETVFISPNQEADIDTLVSESSVTVEVPTLDGEKVVLRPVAVPTIVAAIVEPVQGEGGVREVSPVLMKQLANADFPLIIDEIQSGLGRAGTFLASEGVRGDYYLFAKALGGGVAKISALLVDRRRYADAFDTLYSSTFAGDPFSSRVALTVLELIERKNVPECALRQGAKLKARLERARGRFPGVFREVRGRGMLLGVELDRRCLEKRMVLRTLAERNLFGYVASAHLLNEHSIRVLPTQGAPNTLRVEPSVFLQDDDIERIGSAFEALGETLQQGDTCGLLRFMIADDQNFTDDFTDGEDLPTENVDIEEPSPGATRVAFIAHFVFPERELAMIEPSLRRLPTSARRALAHRLMALVEGHPTVLSGKNLMDGKLWFLHISVPLDPASLEHLYRAGDVGLVVNRIQEATLLAAKNGCQVVALGGFTSILTRDGTLVLPPPGVRVTSGNATTAATGAMQLVSACRTMNIDPRKKDVTLAVIGASGNIGAALVSQLIRGTDGFQRVLLIGRRRPRLEQLRERLLAEWTDLNQGGPAVPAPELETSTDLYSLREATAIAIATNTNDPIVFPHHLRKDREVLIADISLPSAVSDETKSLDNVRVLPLAGILGVPGEPDFRLGSHTPPGMVYCCAAEAMILGLDPEKTSGLSLVGPVAPDTVQCMNELAARMGFHERVANANYRIQNSHTVKLEK